MDKKKKIVFTAIALGCLLVGLTAGFIAGKNSSKVIIESEPYHMEDADYSVGVSEEPNGGPDNIGEIKTAIETTTPKEVSETTVLTENTNNSGNNYSTGENSSSGNQGSGIGVEAEDDDGGGIVPESGGNENDGDNTQPVKPDPQKVSYYDYMNMSSEEKSNFAGQFSSGKEFTEWKNSASEEYAKEEASKTYSGSVNIDETFGNN